MYTFCLRRGQAFFGASSFSEVEGGGILVPSPLLRQEEASGVLMSYFARRRVSCSTFIFCGGAGAFSFAMFFLFVFFVRGGRAFSLYFS